MRQAGPVGVYVSPENAILATSQFTHPIDFAKNILGLGYLTPDQERILDAVYKNFKVAVTAGHSLGKSHVAAILSLWFLYTHYPSKVLTTASSWPQVEDVLWREIRSMHKNAKTALGGRMMNTELDLEELWFAQGRSTDDSTNLQGFHSQHVMMLLDEATGIDPKIWEATQTMAINPETDRMVALGNPTDSTSRFFEECQIPGKWVHLEISCENHPNVVEDRVIIPGAVTRAWVDQMAAEYGRDHPVYEARVLGRWSLKLGRMFPDFEPLVGGRHVFRAGSEILDPWLPKWISIDWGYAHDTAAYLLAWDGDTTWVLDEICVSGRTPGEIGQLVADNWGRYKIEAVYLSHDAMNRTEGPKSRAMLMQEVWSKKGIPRAQRADTDRIGRWNLMTQLFRTGKIKVSSACKKLIVALVKANRNPDKPEDMLKQEGDDPCLVAETLVLTEHGERPISEIRAGDRVITRSGLREVLWSGKTATAAPTLSVSLSTGRVLRGTAAHRVFMADGSLARMDALGYGLKPQTSTAASGSAPVRVLGVTGGSPADVYNLAVDGAHEFFAEGVLVHNCDALGHGLKTPDKTFQLPVDERMRRAKEPATKRGDHMGMFYLEMKFREKEALKRRRGSGLKMSLNAAERRLFDKRRRAASER